MPQSLKKAAFKNFAKGLVTDRSPLNAEPNTMAETQNMVLNRDGSVQRRKRFDVEDGVDFLQDARTLGTGLSLDPRNRGDLKIFLWENVNNDSEFNIVCVYSADTMDFYDASSDPLTNGYINTLTGVITNLESDSTNYSDFAEVRLIAANGEAVISSANTDSTKLLSYNSSSGEVEEREVGGRILVRDIWGWDNKKGITERYTANADESGALTKDEEIDYAHQAYERLNRGWTPTQIKAYSDYQVTNGASDVLWLPPLASSPQMYKDTDLSMNFGLEDNIFFGKSPSRGGSNIVRLFTRGLGTAVVGNLDLSRAALFNKLLDIIDGAKFTELSTSTERFDDDSGGGIADVGYFYGRFWYIFKETEISNSQIGDDEQVKPRIESLVAFSKITSDNIERGYCFQEADPTSEFISDRLVTDGGTLSIREMETPIALHQFAGGILVFARNGVWYITSGSDGFNPTDFIVKKVSRYGVISKECVVEAEGNIYFFGKDDIYRIQIGEGNFPVVQNISFGVISNYYDTVNKSALKWVRSCYDAKNKKVIWQWHEPGVGVYTNDGVLADTQLVYDIILESFYTNKIEAENSQNNSPLGPPIFLSDIDRNSNGKVIYGLFGYDIDQQGDPTDLIYSFAEEKDSGFIDFDDTTGFSGDESDAFFTLNHYSDDVLTQGQSPVIAVHAKMTETGLSQDANGDYTIIDNPGSIKVQAYWDFTDSLTGWGNPQEFQAYKLPRAFLSDSNDGTFDYGKTVITTNNKINGRGRALQLKFSTESGHDFHLYGISLMEASNTNY